MNKSKICVVLFFLLLSATLRQAYGSSSKSTSPKDTERSRSVGYRLSTAEDITPQIIEARSKDEAYLLLEDSGNTYFGKHQYNEFVEFMDSLMPKRKDLEPAINYYTGLARYHQLKYLEESQQWNEYFSQGDFYRGQLAGSLHKAIEGTSYLDEINLNARLALWQYYKDRDDPASGAALSDLEAAVLEYSKIKSGLLPVKKIADALLARGEKQKAKQFYAIYIKKLTPAGTKESELKQAADDFYNEGNIELSQGLYDVYVERILPRGGKRAAGALKSIADKFIYQDDKPCDPHYAEKIFQKIDDSAGASAFDEDSIYLRAFNLEKSGDFSSANKHYLNLIERYPQSSHFDEACYKAGIITTYILKQINSGRGLFEKLAKREGFLSPQVISSYYQLGLLSQWEGDLTGAKNYYAELIEKAGGEFSDTIILARARLAEIEAQKPIEYNLKVFLDASLEKNPLAQTAPKQDLVCRPLKARIGQEVGIEAAAVTGQSGCIPVKTNYLWSGRVEIKEPPAEANSLKVSYNCAGTKEINLVVVSAAGVTGYAVRLIDVYQP